MLCFFYLLKNMCSYYCCCYLCIHHQLFFFHLCLQSDLPVHITCFLYILFDDKYLSILLPKFLKIFDSTVLWLYNFVKVIFLLEIHCLTSVYLSSLKLGRGFCTVGTNCSIVAFLWNYFMQVHVSQKGANTDNIRFY
jgi:hypothetical protein